MNELEFRAWDTELSNWTSPEHIGVDGRGDLWNMFAGTRLKNERWIICRYTGRKSIDDVKCFDGDIVRMAGDTTMVCEVKWDADEGAWGIFYKNINAFKIGMLHFMQIVGNKYENPELLK